MVTQIYPKVKKIVLPDFSTKMFQFIQFGSAISVNIKLKKMNI